MKLYFLTCVFAGLMLNGFSQTGKYNITTLNLNFEQLDSTGKMPSNWIASPNNIKFSTDSIVKFNGKSAVSIDIPTKPAKFRAAQIGNNLPLNYVGKKIVLKGFLKFQDVKDGYVGLMMRLDGETPGMAYDFMQRTQLKGTKDWAEYTIELPFADEMKLAYFGVILTGSGKVWADNLHILIDDKDITAAVIKPLNAIQKDTQFDQSSSLKLNQLTPAQQRDLKLLGKVWGYLKYHHPAVVNGKYNWDYELFRITPKVLATTTSTERNQLLADWVRSLGTFTTTTYPLEKGTVIKSKPDYKWISSASLGKELSSQLNQLINAKRPEDGFYAKLYDKDTPIPQFKNESGYSKFQYPDDGYRLLALFRFWNIVEYFYPYKYGVIKEWDKVLDKYLSKFINAGDELEYKLAAAAVVAELDDSHANLSRTFDPTIATFYGPLKPAIEVRFVDSKPVVFANYEAGTTTGKGLQPGDVIESINGITAAEIIKKQLPYTSASNYPTKLRNLQETILRSKDTLLNITYMREGKTSSVPVKTYPFYSAIYKNPQLNDTAFKVLKPGLAYIDAGKFNFKYVPEVMKSIMDCQSLIIDLRTYPNGQFIQAIGKYLYPAPTDFIKYTQGSSLQPGLFTFMSDEYMKNMLIGEKRDDYFKGRIFILIDENTQSLGEMSAMAFRAAPKAQLVGRQTAGADGNIIMATPLPGGATITFTGIGVYHPDGSETQRIGILPDVKVNATVKGISEGKDEVLDKAVELALK